MKTDSDSHVPGFNPARPLHDYVATHARRAPDAPALLLTDRTVTYGALLAQAEGIALRLREAGVGPGHHVGLLATRGAPQLAGKLAILRAGACCVPLDPGYSDAAQLTRIIGQVPFAAILQTGTSVAAAEGLIAADVPRISLDDIPPSPPVGGWPAIDGEAPATMVFTSGTTGAPKGVVLPHRGLASFSLDQPLVGLCPGDRMLHASSLACDGGLIEVWMALLTGAALAVVESPKPALSDIAATMKRHRATATMQYVGMHNLIVDHHIDAFATVRLANAGGDVLSVDPIRRLMAACPDLKMVNMYGPSETSCVSMAHEIGPEDLKGGPIPIGRPLVHEHAFVVDDDLREVPDGTQGQLVIGGAGVTLGYFGMAERTAAVFIDDPRPGQTGKVYLTGDVALRRADGRFEFFGRADRQIKLGGRRIELDGIEHVLRGCAGVHDAIAVKVKGPKGDARIGAMLQPETPPADEAAWLRVVLDEAAASLHAQMLPRHTLVRGDVPLTRVGKPDRSAIVAEIEATLAPAATPGQQAPASVHTAIAGLWDEVLGCGPLQDGATFFDAGGSSLQLIEAHERLQDLLGIAFDIMLLFETPRLGDLARRLADLGGSVAAPAPEPASEPVAAPARPDAATSAIAIIGYAARVPGADSIDEFWRHIAAGKNLIHRFQPDELEDRLPPELRAHPDFVPARSVLNDVEMFDARYFDILPREAEVMDPQARVFLELCVEALEHAALDPLRARGPVGIFAGCTASTYLLNNVMGDRAQLEDYTSSFQVGNYTTLTGNITDTLATRVAFKLDLTGPALTVHTACSTSLTAIAQAVTALRAGQCDAALAGGISITFPQKRGYLAQEGGMSSPDGLCRPFDAQAGGTVFGHGGGVLVLKRLDDALTDGDRIDAVIRGVGLTNDGADKMAFTAPSVAGQAAAIRAAHRDAGVDPASVGYVECHGTATQLGDPIEVRALAQVFADTPPEGRIALGSVKGNIGHLDAGAGVVSVVKVVEMLKRRQIPPVANYTAPNPRLGLEDTPFSIPATLTDWASDTRRRAGVSGFGVGGTNAHILIEEAPATNETKIIKTDHVQLVPLSAKSPQALARMAAALADVLDRPDAPPLPDVAFTLQQGRSARPFRMAVAAASTAEAATRLRGAPAVTRRAGADTPLAFLFPGQGGQYPGMAAGLARDDDASADILRRGAEVLRPALGTDLLPLLTEAAPDDAEAAATLRQTALAQPALFLVQYATAQYWLARGLRPDRMLGHSVGEFTAATLAGVWTFDTALKLVAERGRLMQALEPGAMLSVRASADDLAPHLDGVVDLAAANAPRLQVLSGPKAAIAATAARLDAAGIANRRLHTSHAFHSRMMDPALPTLEAAVAASCPAAPDLRVVSAATGDWLTGAEATSPAFWARQARQPVLFARAVATLAATGTPMLLEIGAGNVLSGFAAQTLPREAHAGTGHSLPGADRATDADADADADTGTALSLAAAKGAMWSAGVPLDWARATRPGTRKLALPGTVFLRKRHWIDPVPAQPRGEDAPPTPVALPEMPQMQATPPAAAPRAERLTADLLVLFSDLSGEALTQDDAGVPFLELGFDSLFMGQAAQALARDFGVEMTFRSLLSDHPSIAAVAAHLDAVMPAEAAPAATPVAAETPPVQAAPAPAAFNATGTNMTGGNMAGGSGVAAVLHAQMQTMQAVFAEQLRALGQAPATAAPADAAPVTPAPAATAGPEPQDDPPEPPAKRVFSVGRSQPQAHADLTPEQLEFARDLARRYSARFPGSKAHTDAHRPHHADPRTAAGFRPEWKELAFPIVATRAKGATIEDVDGNRLVDLVNGFGQTAFGHSPEFVIEAVTRQMERGFPIGPQCDIAGPTAKRFARMVGHERATFCNTGSEAVMAAMRLARAVTGRDKIVVFGHDYHGQFDEVLVKGKARGEPAALPLAPGIPKSSVANMVVLPYGEPGALDWVRDNLAQLAAVVVEPVQSRAPEHRPVDFVRALRRVTREGGVALVVDEVVTGFRTHARGMQGLWDIDADMATYGKVVGGGMPVGVLAGSRRFMDALDGGEWRFGDDSEPQVSPTFFAGTFVRHPLVVAAVDAVLDHLESDGEALWTGTASRTTELASQMNAALARRGLPDLVKQFSSWFVIKVSQHDPRATLLFPLMRLNGVHAIDGFCGFMTTAHGAAECATILSAFETALDELQSVGILAPAAAGDAQPVAAQPDAAKAPAGPVALTESQREIWMAHQQGDQPAAAFNEGLSLRLDGEVNPGALRAALADLVARHDALRLRFARDGATFTVSDDTSCDLPLHDVSDAPNPEAALADLIAEDAKRPIDIVAGPPLRAALVRLGPASQVLVLTAHHIVCDGWSYGVLLSDLAALYTARSEGRAADLAPPRSFAAVARRLGSEPPAPQTHAFWREALADLPPLPDLPTDRPRGGVKSFAGATTTAQIPPELVKKLRKAGAPAGATLFAMLFACLQITLGRLAGTGKVVIGMPTAGQALAPENEVVGHLVNFLPVRADFDNSDPARTHVERVAKAVLQALEHGDVTLGALVRDFEIERSLNRLPCTEVQFNLERGPETLKFGSATARAEGNARAAVNFDLFFNMVDGRSGLRIEVDYSTALFDEATIQRWLGHFRTLSEALAADMDQPIAALPLLDDAAGRGMAEGWNGTEAAFDRTATLPDLFARMVRERPDAVAAEDAERSVTYAQLAQESDALAALIQTALPTPGERVGVALNRGVALLAALIAVMKAGHTYVPLDPAQPQARLLDVLDTARAAAVVGGADAAPLATLDRPRIDPSDATPGDRPGTVASDPDMAAYVIFTSGSTGKPKGVAVPHRAVVNFLASMAREPGLTAEDRLLSVTTVSFDIAVLELFLPLCVGATVEIASRDATLDGLRIVERLHSGEITAMQATPTYWGMLCEAGFRPTPRLKMLAGGEPLPSDLADTLTENGAELWNMYGPTETTVWSSLARVVHGRPVTIGAPIANTEMHVLDDDDRLCPPGVEGELNIGGAGLALGYFDRPDLTDAAFRDVTLAGRARRLYRTGDLAIRNADGSLRLLGRRDGQVKLRGFRIELGEIEARLRQQPGCAAAAVALRPAPSGLDQLVACVVPKTDTGIDHGALARALSEALPNYMVPTAWITLDALPQTANGKLDRKALPAATEAQTLRAVQTIVAPETATEEAIAALWRDVLGRDELSVSDTLYALGIDSLAIFRLAARMLQAGHDIEARDILTHPSVRGLAAHIDERARKVAGAKPSLMDFARGPRRTGT